MLNFIVSVSQVHLGQTKARGREVFVLGLVQDVGVHPGTRVSTPSVTPVPTTNPLFIGSPL